LQHALKFVGEDGIVVFLLRMGWLEAGGSQRTAEKALWLPDRVPDLYLLQRRPSFVKGPTGGNDSATYAWMVWRRTRKRNGTVTLLSREECSR
jgi:hypothetical protein